MAITLDNSSGWIRQANHKAAAEPISAVASKLSSSKPSGVAELGHAQEGLQHSARQSSRRSSLGPILDSLANLHLQSKPQLLDAELAGSSDIDGINIMPFSSCSHQDDDSDVLAAASQAPSEAGPDRLLQQEATEPAPEAAHPSQLQPPITFLGSKLFSKCVSGTRVIARHKHQKVAGYDFEGYGSHCDDYGHCYLTAAAALGATMPEVDEFLRRLDTCMKQFSKQASV